VVLPSIFGTKLSNIQVADKAKQLLQNVGLGDKLPYILASYLQGNNNV